MSITFNFSRGFVKDFKRLQKRYRLIEQDVDALMAEMEHESYRGDYMPNFGKELYKVRLTNRSARRGKRGGFRIIYARQADETCLFLHIYSKSDKNDTSASEIRRMLRDLD